MEDTDKITNAVDSIVKSIWSIWPSIMPEPTVPGQFNPPISADGRLVYGYREYYAKCRPLVESIFDNMFVDVRKSSEETRLTFARLLTEIAVYEKDKALPEKGLTIQRIHQYLAAALSLCEEIHSSSVNAVLGDVHFAIGSLAMDTGDFAASRDHKKMSFTFITRICEENNLEDMRLYLAYAEYGNAHVQDGDLELGETLLKEAIRIRVAAGETTPRSGDANLALCLIAQSNALGRSDDLDDIESSHMKLTEAANLIEEGLEARLKVIGRHSNTPDARTAMFYCAYADLQKEVGLANDVVYYLELAYQRVPALGRFRGNIRMKLANAYLESGHFPEKAEQLLTGDTSDFTSFGEKHVRTHRWEFLRSKANLDYKPNLQHWKPELRAKFEAGTLTMKDFDPYVAFNER